MTPERLKQIRFLFEAATDEITQDPLWAGPNFNKFQNESGIIVRELLSEIDNLQRFIRDEILPAWLPEGIRKRRHEVLGWKNQMKNEHPLTEDEQREEYLRAVKYKYGSMIHEVIPHSYKTICGLEVPGLARLRTIEYVTCSKCKEGFKSDDF